MDIKTPEELAEAIEIAKAGKNDLIFYDIGRYIAYNYYMYTQRIGSETDLKNEDIYKKFEAEYPDLYTRVEAEVDNIYIKINKETDL